jgi:hypothetical protein
LTRIYTTTHIRQPIERVFDYVTTPGNWPAWHPSSLGVMGATDHSLEPGEQVTETFYVAWRRGQVVWTVRERAAPCRWLIEGQIVGSRNEGTITYLLKPQDNGTFLEREFTYAWPNPFLALLDRLILRRRVEVESAEALRRLKQVLETTYSTRFFVEFAYNPVVRQRFFAYNKRLKQKFHAKEKIP